MSAEASVYHDHCIVYKHTQRNTHTHTDRQCTSGLWTKKKNMSTKCGLSVYEMPIGIGHRQIDSVTTATCSNNSWCSLFIEYSHRWSTHTQIFFISFKILFREKICVVLALLQCCHFNILHEPIIGTTTHTTTYQQLSTHREKIMDCISQGAMEVQVFIQ